MDKVKNEKQLMPLLVPYEPEEFWQRIREIVSEEINRLNKTPVTTEYTVPGLTYKPLYKIEEVCAIFMISKPTVYEWIKADILRPFKVQSRVFFLWEDIQQLIKGK